MGKNWKIEIDKRWFPLFKDSIIRNKRIVSLHSIGLFDDRLQLLAKNFQNPLGIYIKFILNYAKTMIQKLWSVLKSRVSKLERDSHCQTSGIMVQRVETIVARQVAITQLRCETSRLTREKRMNKQLLRWEKYIYIYIQELNNLVHKTTQERRRQEREERKIRDPDTRYAILV